MKELNTYECKKCGKSYVKTEAGARKEVPLYCCGEEVKRKSKEHSQRKNKNGK
jgi:hypothetical protein